MVKDKFSEISNYFPIQKLRHDKRVVAFIVCLAISTALWFLNALSKDYETTVVFPVKYINTPEKRFFANTPPQEFELKVDAHGFTLLRNKLNLSFAPIILDVSRVLDIATEIRPMVYSVSGVRLKNRITSQISNEIKIIEVRPETITLTLDSMQTKKVPVIPGIEIEYAPQYNITAAMKISPDSVTTTGPGSILDTINYILTEHKKYVKVKKPIIENLDLITPKKISLSHQKAQLQVKVEEFTEKKFPVPVKASGMPSGISVKLFPSEVQVSFLVGLSKYAEITAADFNFSILYPEIEKGGKSIAVQLHEYPEYIREIKYSPQSVEFLIEKE